MSPSRTNARFSAVDTRPLLSDVGLLQVVDATILSCGTGFVKPDQRIYRAAVAMVGLEVRGAVLVDDKESFCLGAETIGMSSILINGSEPGPTPHEKRPFVRALSDVGPDWTATHP